MYADDAKFTNEDPIKPQNDLLILYSWARKNKLKFKNNKSFLIRVMRKRHNTIEQPIIVFFSNSAVLLLVFSSYQANTSGVLQVSFLRFFAGFSFPNLKLSFVRR